ncbi:hypothetical protein J6590_008037 [Homalodisca vitripennis]|nr:hypothetical protein J6590_008037 [Homalodisca vitripennis]
MSAAIMINRQQLPRLQSIQASLRVPPFNNRLSCWVPAVTLTSGCEMGNERSLDLPALAEFTWPVSGLVECQIIVPYTHQISDRIFRLGKSGDRDPANIHQGAIAFRMSIISGTIIREATVVTVSSSRRG